MNISTIKSKVDELSWNSSKEKQIHAIEYLSDIDPLYYYLIFKETDKSTWENAVKVIHRIGYPKNKVFINQLIWLLQDINWPGVIESIEILSEMEKKEVIPMLQTSIKKAYDEEDYMWIGGIKRFIEFAGYTDIDFSDNNIIALLEYSDF